jgi:nucleoside-diphosphate-sugar epimerase
LSDKDSLLAATEGVDGIIHAAGLVKARRPADFHRTNEQGTANLLAAAKQNAPSIRRFVLVSSLAVMGPSEDGRPVPAGADPNPVTHYGRSKLAAERAARAEAHALPITIIRPPMIYGPRDREILPFFKSVQLGLLPLTGSPNSCLSAIYAADCAAACINALEAKVPSGSAYFVEDGRLETLAGLIAHIENAIGRRAWLRVPVPRVFMYGAALGSELYGRVRGTAVMLTRDKLNELLAPHWVCDSTEAQIALGWKPRISFEEGTRLTGAWYRREGWL